jgi:YegS/Rv2252/BmrU family lipid kinase
MKKPANVEPGRRLAFGDRVLVIANPVTRRNAIRLATQLKLAAPSGVALDVRFTSFAGEASEIAASSLEDARMVVAIGGDGTVADCASALIGTDVPLAVIPGGSTNITAREQGVPIQAQRAANLLFGDFAVRRIDAGSANERLFLHMAGAGFDARLFETANPALKRKIGWLAYLPGAMSALREQPATFRVIVDGTRHDFIAPLVLIANGPSIIHPRFRLLPDVRDDDGFLDAVIVIATTPVELARTLARLAIGQLDKSPYVRHLRGVEIRLESTVPVPVERDGDPDGITPQTFRVLPSAVRMVVPPG